MKRTHIQIDEDGNTLMKDAGIVGQELEQTLQLLEWNKIFKNGDEINKGIRIEELKLLRKWMKGKQVYKEKVRAYINERIKELK